ncbi:hypothetical protein SprV_0200937200 [Sparganum proliferum]
MADDLRSQGFEIVTDENGQELVKLMFMDENNETSGYALVSTEDAKKIMAGEATLQNVVDEEGKQVLTLVPVEPELTTAEQEDGANPTMTADAADGEPAVTAAAVAAEDFSASESTAVDQKTTEPALSAKSPADANATTAAAAKPAESHTAADDAVVASGEADAIAATDENVEQYTITEQTAILNGQPIRMVSLVDTAGNVLDQKHGQVGEQVVIELHGQAFVYEMRGPIDGDEPITSTLLVSAAEAEEEAEGTPSQQTAAGDAGTGHVQWTAEAQQSETAAENPEMPAGQQFTLTEAVAIVDGKPMQTVILEDDKGNLLDQKQGHAGEHAIIELNGHSLDYVFLGPSETGEPITTVLVVAADEEGQDGEMQEGGGSLVSESEAGMTAANWCPQGLSQELYASLRLKAEAIVNERLQSRIELSYPHSRPEPYHRKLGPYAAYQEMVELVKTYKAGASQGETLERYEMLRTYAKIFRSSGPQARPLTVFEMVVNEVAAQLCRFKPGLLFHKRELFHLSKEIAESCRVEIEAVQAQLAAGPFVTGPAVTQQQQQQSQSAAHGGAQPSQESGAAVSGQVANSQLALLESRGLTAIQPTSSATPSSAVAQQAIVASSTIQTAESAASAGVLLAFSKDGATAVDQQPLTIVGQGASPIGLPTIRGKMPIGNSTLQHYLPSMPTVRRELAYKLAASEEEALRLAAISVLSDIPSMDIKPKSDCTNIERACWEQAVDLSARADSLIAAEPSSAAAGPNAVANLLVNDAQRVDSVREMAALYGRTVVSGTAAAVAAQQQQQQQLLNPYIPPPRSPSLPVLTPYEVACNEAAAYLAAGQPALLTRRRDLVELARKVVRNSGFQFPHTPNMDRGSGGPGGYRLYCADQLMELDLSAAEQLLLDPLERTEPEENLHSYSPKSESTEGECPSLDLSCEEHNNIIDEVAIYAASGTDSLKKVRILNLADCSFTGLIPLHLNFCINLVELNLSNNCLHAIPRCLYLPKLRRLNIRGNPMLSRFCHIEGPPLVEQFARLVSLELDPDLKDLLKPQALAYLCPHLSSINGEEFHEEASEDTIKAAQSAKQELAALIHSKWEDDLVGFYKKSVPHRDLIRVLETLVLHAVNQSVAVDEPFSHCKAVLARRIAEEFLAPKVVDEEEDEEGTGGSESTYHHRTASESEQADEDADLEDSETVTAPKPKTVAAAAAATAKTPASTVDSEAGVKPEPPSADDNKLPSTEADGVKQGDEEAEKKRAAEQAAVAEREALAAASNMALLPDEPLDKLSNIIGMALQHGKTVIYSVIRTAARQPNGELIPVGSSLSGSAVNGPAAADGKSGRRQTDEGESSESEASPSETQSRRSSTAAGRLPTGGAVIGARRPGLIGKGMAKRRPSAAAAAAARAKYAEDSDDLGAYTPHSGYGDLDEEAEENESPQAPKHHSSWEPGKRGRPALSQSQRKALVDAEEQETVAMLQKVRIPPPHSPPPATLRMSTRDSNRMKRFSAYGAIDTAAALAGQQKALITAAFAMEDDEEVEREEGELVDEDYEAHLAEDAREEQEGEGVAVVDVTHFSDSHDDDQVLRADGATLSPRNNVAEARKKRKAAGGQVTTIAVKAKKAESGSPAKNLEDEATLKQIVNLSLEQDSELVCPSLLQLGEIVDYDPLHFIRCHARDNDPLDCSTKVWRCAFEPNPLDPKNSTTTVVATCGGECVCLIDCRTGKVMKRFKHIGEEFYTVAWTTVEMATGHQTNLLAAAGKMREIRLLHPEQLVCYAEMRGHKDEVACMLFHPYRPTVLFSGDSKAFILVWDIGIPSAPEYSTKHQLLMRLVCPRANLNPVLNLAFMPNYDTLLAGCEDGVFAWTLQDFRKEKVGEERPPTMEIKVPTRREPCFDGLARLSENLFVVKCVEEGEIYVIDFSQLLLRKKRTTAAKKVVPAEVLGCLRWQTTEEIYINVTSRPGLGAVVCGDNEGTIWLYDLQTHVRSQKDGKKFKLKPVKILEWPECSVGGNREDDVQLKESITSGFKNPVINATDISSDGAYLVAVTDNNLVCIWNFSG